MRKTIILLLSLVSFLASSDRIIALSPAINEIIYALDSGDKIVGNTLYCIYPKSSIDKPKVGGYFDPNLEKILALRPSLIVMQNHNVTLDKKLKKLGIKTKSIKIDKLENIKNSILELGILLDKEQKAKQIVKSIEDGIKQTQNIVKDKKILFVIGHNTSLQRRVFVAGDNLYFDDIIRLSGNKNAFHSDRKGQPILNYENIIKTDADIVILLAHARQKYGYSKSDLIDPWYKLPISASKTKSIYMIDKLYCGIPSDRLTLFLRDFTNILKDYKNKIEIK